MSAVRAAQALVLGALALLPALPLLVASRLAFPYVVGKHLAFRVLTEVAAAGWLVLWASGAGRRPPRSRLLGALLALLAALAVADLAGVHPARSLLGSLERLDGLVSWAHLVVLVLVAASALDGPAAWRRWFLGSLGVSALVAALALLEATRAPWLAGLLPALADPSRSASTIGNPAFLAGYLLVHLFLAAGLAAEAWADPARRALAGGLLAVLVLDAAALVATGTRGALLAALAGAAAAAGLLLAGRPRRDLALAGGLALALFAAGALAAPRWERAAPWGAGPVARLASGSLAEDGIRDRLLSYRMAWAGALERPWLGWGQEAFPVVVDRHLVAGFGEQRADRVHDLPLDLLLAGGLPAVAAASLLLLALVRALRRAPLPPGLRAALAGLLVAYGVHNLLLFPEVTALVPVAMVLALLAALEGAGPGGPEGAPGEPAPRHLRAAAAALASAAALAALVGWLHLPVLRGAAALRDALAAEAGAPEQALAALERAGAQGPVVVREVGEAAGRLALRLAGDASTTTPALRARALEVAGAALRRSAEASPEARPAFLLGLVRQAAGDAAGAAAALEEALGRAPARVPTLLALADLEAARCDQAAAAARLEAALQLAPGDPRVVTRRAAQAIRAGDDALAERLLAPLAPRGEAADDAVAAALLARGQAARVVALWRPRVALRPRDAAAHFMLASALWAAGERAEAVTLMEWAVEAFPEEAPEAAGLLQDFRSGSARVLVVDPCLGRPSRP